MAQYYAIRKSSADDELKHWKYVKRVRVGNKWKYYYDSEGLKNDIKDKLGYDEKEAYDKAVRSKNAIKPSMESWKASKENAESKIERWGNSPEKQKALEYATKYYEEDLRMYQEAQTKVTKTLEAYKKTPLHKIKHLEYKVQKGLEAVSKFFSKKNK